MGKIPQFVQAEFPVIRLLKSQNARQLSAVQNHLLWPIFAAESRAYTGQPTARFLTQIVSQNE